MLDNKEGQNLAALVLLAMISGFVGHLMRQIERGGKIRWLVALLEAAASGIVGFIAILMCEAIGLSYQWTGVIVGLMGWLGATSSVGILEKVVHKKLGIDK